MAHDEDWVPPGVRLSQPEAIRVLGLQVQGNTRSIGHVAAEVERHEHWHEQQLEQSLAAARTRPRETWLLLASSMSSLAGFAGVIIAVLAHH